jgi:hypothetical protein
LRVDALLGETHESNRSDGYRLLDPAWCGIYADHHEEASHTGNDHGCTCTSTRENGGNVSTGISAGACQRFHSDSGGDASADQSYARSRADTAEHGNGDSRG